jgi:hypothetical protein
LKAADPKDDIRTKDTFALPEGSAMSTMQLTSGGQRTVSGASDHLPSGWWLVPAVVLGCAGWAGIIAALIG